MRRLFSTWSHRALGMGGAALLALILPAKALSGQATTQSPHERLPDGLACVGCHTTAGWSPLRADLEFDHGDDAGFALDGQHAGLACVNCHATARFDEVAVAEANCASCHLDVHQAAFDRNCVECHTTESFSEIESWAVHPADFPLEGAHLQVTCESCHISDLGGAFVSLDVECEACHIDAYASTILIDHEALGFPTECTQCHSNFAWRDIPDFDHTAISGGFELGGTHIGLECSACHSGPGGEVLNSPMDAQDCVACHLSDYQAEHSGAAFPTDCTQCHNNLAWGDVAGFDHLALSGFEIRAAHVGLACSACHSGPAGEVPNPPTNQLDCVACHLSDYQAQHTGSGFSTECTQCHTETTWGGATFDHPYFPIFSGPHDISKAGRDCTTCHTVPADQSSFTCFQCHQHDQGPMDDKHSEEPGYVYDSSFCYSCHMDGRK